MLYYLSKEVCLFILDHYAIHSCHYCCCIQTHTKTVIYSNRQEFYNRISAPILHCTKDECIIDTNATYNERQVFSTVVLFSIRRIGIRLSVQCPSSQNDNASTRVFAYCLSNDLRSVNTLSNVASVSSFPSK